MYASVSGMSVAGLSAQLIKVEVDISNGLPAFDIVGLANTSVKEAKDRVRSALRNSGFSFPLQRITVNLAPADLRKEGSGLDLPIALGILAAMNEIDSSLLRNYIFAGELSLEGLLRPITGILTMAVCLRQLQIEDESWDSVQDESLPEQPFTLVIPPGNLAEARIVPGIMSESVVSLARLVRILKKEESFSVTVTSEQEVSNISKPQIDWSDINGQNQAKRALELAAAGGHNLLRLCDDVHL
ncbi:MAG: hypothetical protein APF84_12605 [Gracilibacter sp. BRH_c7a]|nr:MAG: hypothetical protein APF84_12605 [Gracilibacter sp. BRH_c7a]